VLNVRLPLDLFPADDLADDADRPDEVFFAPDDEPLLLLRDVDFEPLAELALPALELELVFELDFLPDLDDEDDFDLPPVDEDRLLVERLRDEPPPEADVDLRPPLDLREPVLLPRAGVIVSAAAPTAPTAAPAAAPPRMSAATSITLSTISEVVDFLDLEEPCFDCFDEEELFFEFPELDLAAINFPP
jgi:hypothetical protein